MCGIFCTISRDGHASPSSNATRLLQDRGPDSLQEHRVTLKNQANQDVFLSLSSSVLSLRGQNVTVQPLVDEQSGCVLCWNGEAWKLSGHAVAGNDSIALFKILVQAALKSERETGVLKILEQIRGPFSLVFYDGQSKMLYFGRDCLGRRSLLKTTTSTGTTIISSVCDLTLETSWSEVEADGIHSCDLLSSSYSSSGQLAEQLTPYVVSSLLAGSLASQSIVS
jgi:asparagine synthetase B (glutamine-hydrolysing)